MWHHLLLVIAMLVPVGNFSVATETQSTAYQTTGIEGINNEIGRNLTLPPVPEDPIIGKTEPIALGGVASGIFNTALNPNSQSSGSGLNGGVVVPTIADVVSQSGSGPALPTDINANWGMQRVDATVAAQQPVSISPAANKISNLVESGDIPAAREYALEALKQNPNDPSLQAFVKMTAPTKAAVSPEVVKTRIAELMSGMR